MIRSKRLVLVCHCVLNQNSVVYPLARAGGAFKFVKYLMDDGVGIIQLPCPELRYLGTARNPMNKDEYDTWKYRELCINLFNPIMDEIDTYLANGYILLGIIGINNSPTCSISGIMGIFMEEIFKLLRKKEIQPKYIEVPESYEDEIDSHDFYLKVKQNLKL